MSNMLRRDSHGFTIVELLIVIVVIATLAAISVVAYNGIQQRARDAQRVQDIQVLAKALELYYIDNGHYPACTGSTSINGSWCTTADSSWANMSPLLADYIAKVPRDPISKQTGTGQFPWNVADGYDYSYVATSGYCGITPSSQLPQMYIIVYKLEQSEKQNLIGICTTNQLQYAGSNHRVVKGT